MIISTLYRKFNKTKDEYSDHPMGFIILTSYIICAILLLFSLTFKYIPFSIKITSIIILVILEILYWADPKKKENDWNKWAYVIFKKGECLIEAISIITAINLMYLGYDKIKDNLGTVLKVLGIIIIVLLVIVIYFWLNGLKYQEKKCQKKLN